MHQQIIAPDGLQLSIPVHEEANPVVRDFWEHLKALIWTRKRLADPAYSTDQLYVSLLEKKYLVICLASCVLLSLQEHYLVSPTNNSCNVMCIYIGAPSESTAVME